MTNDDKIKYEKLQWVINREAAKISALTFEKTDKYEYLTGEERHSKRHSENKRKQLKVRMKSK